MATYEGDIYRYEDGLFIDAGGPVATNTGVVENDNDSTFVVGEPSVIGANVPAVYSGTINVDGTEYPVFEGGTGFTNLDFVVVPPGAPFPATANSPLPAVTQQDITFAEINAICFHEDTLILTSEGEVKVKSLQIGDLVLTADGRAVPVKWIGRQTVHKLFTVAERFVPVRVSAGALGDGLPHTDLVLTADHALIIDGLAINAGALVNGTTIFYDPIESLPSRVTYYHVETEEHDLILANGAAAETYVDYVGRQAFDNYDEYLALYGEERTIPEMPQPRISAARLVPPSVKAQLNGKDAA